MQESFQVIVFKHVGMLSCQFSRQWPPQPSDTSLTLCLRQGGEEGLEAGGEPLHALVQVGQSLQVADVTQDLVLGDQLVPQVPGQHLWLLGKSHSEKRKKEGEEENR